MQTSYSAVIALLFEQSCVLPGRKARVFACESLLFSLMLKNIEKQILLSDDCYKLHENA